MDNNNLLDHLEKVYDDYGDVADKIPLEDKMIASFEARARGLEPWEISQIVQGAMNSLPEGLAGHVTELFDVVYDAISEALDKSRR